MEANLKNNLMTVYVCSEMLYRSRSGMNMMRLCLESLAVVEHVWANVLEGWDDLLNFEEQLRNLSSPKRFFFKKDIMPACVLNESEYDYGTRYGWFRDNIRNATEDDSRKRNLKKIDMIFFLLRLEEHFICVVYDMKKPAYEILDNMIHTGDVADFYEPKISFGGLGMEKYEKRRKSVEIGQSQLRELFATVNERESCADTSDTIYSEFVLRFSIICRYTVVTTELLEAFEEPEREFRKRNKKKSKANKVRPRALNFEMGDDAPMWTARRTAPTVPTNPITKPNLDKEIPGKLLHMIKYLTFDGKNDSNPIVHLENFMDICDLFKTEESRDDAIRLRVFSLTLAGEAKAWLRSLEPSSITTWEGLRSNFLSRFFPPSKIDKLRAEIRSFPQDDEETISESHGLSKRDQVQNFCSGLGYSSRATLDSSAGGVFMYKTPTEGYKLLEDMLIHNIDWRTDKRLQIPRMAGKISTDFDPSDELAAMKNQQVKFERKIEELIKSVHALQVGCEECKGPHLTKDCPNRPMMTPEGVHYLNRGDYEGRWKNNRNFNPRRPGFFAPNQQNQRTEGELRISIEDRLIQFMDAQKKINDEVGSYLCNHQSTIQNLEMQVGRISQLLSERTQGELPTQTQVNPKVDNAKPMFMVAGATSKNTWTDIYTKKYVESDSGSEPDYATDYDSEGFTISFEFEYKALWALKKVHLDDIASGKERLINLHELEELRSPAYENSKIYKEQRKKWHDAHLKEVKVFKEGDKILMYQTRFKFSPTKLKSRCIGPYVVLKTYPSGYVDLMTERGQFKVNGHRLKLYHKDDPVRNGEVCHLSEKPIT
ncbi:hypothetical protein OSB04_027714 [Centaurea solstitialis]|uniref:Retrotransposon gag domain-containing protein n=1 Tax=Centaurea solstitialis TaxID=347529 RepID=A0AA38SZA0_9ASTR|nr:hypothetical protein OSB04_027714 [Centaurea solstitialis]